jgi:hypothetical protein
MAIFAGVTNGWGANYNYGGYNSPDMYSGASCLMGSPMSCGLTPMGGAPFMNPAMMQGNMMMMMAMMMMMMQMMQRMQGMQGGMPMAGMPFQQPQFGCMPQSPPFAPPFQMPYSYGNYSYPQYQQQCHPQRHRQLHVTPSYEHVPCPRPRPQPQPQPEASPYLDPLQPLRDDLRTGRQEVADRHTRIDHDRDASRRQYAAGEHGLGREIVNQAWDNARENVGNLGTAVTTGGRAAWDTVVEAPGRVIHNVGVATRRAIGTVARGTGHALEDAGRPIAQDIHDGQAEIAARDRAAEREREQSRRGYAAGEHGLGREIVNQAWSHTTQAVGDAVTTVGTAGRVVVDTALAPARFVGSAASRAWGWLTGS